MKISYMAFLKLLKKCPNEETLKSKKPIPGDEVEVADSFKKFLKKEEILEIDNPETAVREAVCDGCKKIMSRCACAKRAARVERRKAALKAIDPEESLKKEDKTMDIDMSKTNKILEKKSELKKSGKTKLEQKQELNTFKEELGSVAVAPKEASKLIKPDVVEAKEAPKAVEAKVEVKEEPKKAKKKKKLKGKGKIRKNKDTGEFVREE